MAEEKSKSEKEALSLEFLEFLAEFDDEKEGLLDPETLEPMAKNSGAKCITQPVKPKSNAIELENAKIVKSKPEQPVNVIDNKDCQSILPDVEVKLAPPSPPTIL